jgi:glycosyltransferase involved in cell wall biosynthesis
MTTVLVLLSTWNGVKYLPAQIDSLLEQDFGGELAILIRDDGSSDGTVEYIRSRNDPRIRLVEGANLGPRGSFFELLRMARNENADFFALCDQDDFWRPNKIRRALALLEGDGPVLYASSLDLVDENLTYMQNFVHPGAKSFVSTLLSNFVTGCTCVFNRAFLERLPFPSDADRTLMHDWWLASVATLEGKIVYDRQSFIGYRQHGQNHVGIQTGIADLYLKLRKAIVAKQATTRFDHVKQLVAAAGDRFSDLQREVAGEFLSGQTSWLLRLKFVLRYRAQLGIRSAVRFVLFC